MLENNTFYPTPEKLISKMWSKIKNKQRGIRVLEPSAGKGAVADYISKRENHSYSGTAVNVSCIEIDSEFQAILRSKKHKVIDSNFLSYSGTDRFDIIIANPPFDEGEYHLRKAIDILYSGEIVFLLNAETIKNPYSNQRKELVIKLKELNADIEYIQNAFVNAERKTQVEVALVYIKIERNIEDDFFKNCTDTAHEHIINIEQDSDVVSGNTICSKVEIYNDSLKSGLNVIENYYTHYNKINKYITLNTDIDSKHSNYYNNETLNEIVNNAINDFVFKLRKESWQSVLDSEEVRSRMTQNKIDEFNFKLEERSNMDFTESNIRAFIIELIGNYENTLTDAVAEIFKLFTEEHSWCEEVKKNIHYFNGWKTNKSFFVNPKVILPMSAGYGHPFIGWQGWQLDYKAERQLDDIDKVMNYFDASTDYVSIATAVKEAFKENIIKNIESTYFKISVFKKRTIHLTFKDENIRRRFNITACKYKKWLPEDYGKKSYTELNVEEQSIVEEFEGRDSYDKNINQIEFQTKNCLRLA
jgi:phospholipid N-methyltransferase